MTLRQRRVLFTKLLMQLVQHINEIPGFEVALDEGRVITPRQVWDVDDKTKIKRKDALHIRASYHYLGLAQDILLYRNGEYISDGNDKIWEELDDFCRRLDPNFGLGIRFRDPNHVSYGEYRREVV
jgi:hypothetical protein